MKKLKIDVSEMWDNLSRDDVGILFGAFIDESRALTEKWCEGNAHVTLQEKRAVGVFLVDIGAIQLEVKGEMKKGFSPIKVEVHRTRTHEQQTLLASQQDGIPTEERAREEEKCSAQDERDVADTDDDLADATYEHESDNSWSGGDEDVSDDEYDDNDDLGCHRGNARRNVLLPEVTQLKSSASRRSRVKCNPEVSFSKDANDDADGAESSQVSQLEHEGMGGTNSTIESSQVQDESTTEMEASGTPHKCSLCHSSFPSMWQLDLHVYKCELSLLYFYCPLCGKSYRRKQSLSVHLQRVHDMAASEIIERLKHLAAYARGKCDKRPRKRKRTSVAKKQDKDSDFVGSQSFEGIRTRSGAILKKDSASSLDHSSNGEEDDLGSGFSSDDLGKEEVKHDTLAPGLTEGRTDSESHQEEQINGEMECSEVGHITTKEHVAPGANNDASASRPHSPDGRAGISQGNSPTQKQGITESVHGDADSKQEQRQEKKSKGYVCHLCGETFRSSFWLRCHIKTDHFGETYECSTCGKKLPSLDHFKRHLELHSDPEGAPYKCDMCNGSFKSKQGLNIHRNNMHLKKRIKYTCEICHAILSTKGSLKCHMNSVHTKEAKYPCEQCGRIFHFKKRLEDHMEVHTGTRKWKCDQCDSCFFRERDLMLHKKKVHVPSDYLCDLCGGRFKRQKSLKDHYQSVHTDTFNYTCEMCGKRFKTKGLLSSHRKVHLDLRPHKCQLCEKSFRKAFILRVHMDWHNGVRKFKCSVCDKSFLTKGNLDKHMQKHLKNRAHTCEECDRAFPDLTALRRHLAKVHGIVVESKLTKAATRVNTEHHGAKTHETSNTTWSTPTVNTLAPDVPSIPPEGDGVLPSPDDQTPVVPAQDLSTGISARTEPQGVSLGMEFVANNVSCVEESIPAFKVGEEGQATDALMHMMLPSSYVT